MPGIIAKRDNQVPACVTPGRLAAYLKSRNSGLDRRFEHISVDYMRSGETLNVRWDFAFFQMLVETGNLKFSGDVNANQNNFAGMGATGRGNPGERFESVTDGVKAHLQHLQMYAGVNVENPVSERTRKVQEWRVLDRWRSRLKRDVTFTDMATQWAPGSRGYPGDIASVAESFMNNFCNQPDPAPELLAMARGGNATPSHQTTRNASFDERPSGEELARRAGERARAEGGHQRSALGAGSAALSNLQILNSNADQQSAPPATPQSEPSDKAEQTAPANTEARTKGCKVWTASYGGQKAVIIKTVVSAQANYTVLDVNDGREAREVAAYIQAYAKGGKKIHDFSSTAAALEKAFELCPEN